MPVYYHPDTKVLWIGPNEEYDNYELDIEKMTSSAAMLDGIMQVAGKHPKWITDADLGAMVRVLYPLLTPQSTLCGFEFHGGGNGRKMTKKQLREVLDKHWVDPLLGAWAREILDRSQGKEPPEPPKPPDGTLRYYTITDLYRRPDADS